MKTSRKKWVIVDSLRGRVSAIRKRPLMGLNRKQRCTKLKLGAVFGAVYTQSPHQCLSLKAWMAVFAA